VDYFFTESKVEIEDLNKDDRVGGVMIGTKQELLFMV
jgi:hypothetical protein